MKTAPNWIQQADQAMQRAAIRARELAMRTNTSVHVVKDGTIIELVPMEPSVLVKEEIRAYSVEKMTQSKSL